MKTITKPSFEEEKLYWKSGIDFVIGLDEVGRGAFAGPIVAAGVVFDRNVNTKFVRGVNDSKLINPRLREELSEIIKANSIFAIESVEIDYINKNGIGKANSAVFRKVLRSLIMNFEQKSNYFILIDGFHKKYLPGGIKKQKGIVKGDQKSLSIAAASILAKVYRDNLMQKESKKYPNYLFERNKGYGSRAHRQALKEFGLIKIHRTSFNLSQYL